MHVGTCCIFSMYTKVLFIVFSGMPLTTDHKQLLVPIDEAPEEARKVLSELDELVKTSLKISRYEDHGYQSLCHQVVVERLRDLDKCRREFLRNLDKHHTCTIDLEGPQSQFPQAILLMALGESLT